MVSVERWLFEDQCPMYIVSRSQTVTRKTRASLVTLAYRVGIVLLCRCKQVDKEVTLKPDPQTVTHLSQLSPPEILEPISINSICERSPDSLPLFVWESGYARLQCRVYSIQEVSRSARIWRRPDEPTSGFHTVRTNRPSQFCYCVGNWEHWQLSTLNLLRHGGVEYVTDNDEVLHSTKSYGVVRRWLRKVGFTLESEGRSHMINTWQYADARTRAPNWNLFRQCQSYACQ